MSWDIFGTERAALRKRNSEILNEKFNVEYENKKLKQQIEQAQEEIKKLGQIKCDVSYYKNQYELACRENDVLKHKLNTLKNEPITLKKNIVFEPDVISENIELVKSIAEMRETIKEKDNEIFRLNSEIESHQVKATKIEEMYANLLREKNDIETKYSKLRSHNKHLQKQIDALTKENAELKEETNRNIKKHPILFSNRELANSKLLEHKKISSAIRQSHLNKDSFEYSKNHLNN